MLAAVGRAPVPGTMPVLSGRGRGRGRPRRHSRPRHGVRAPTAAWLRPAARRGTTSPSISTGTSKGPAAATGREVPGVAKGLCSAAERHSRLAGPGPRRAVAAPPTALSASEVCVEDEAIGRPNPTRSGYRVASTGRVRHRATILARRSSGCPRKPVMNMSYPSVPLR